MKKPFSRKTFYRLFFSAFSVLLIPILLILMSFSFAMKDTVMDDYLALNSQIVDNVSRTVDTAITSQTNFAFSLKESKLLREISANLMDNRIELQESCQELQSYMKAILFNNIASMNAIYFPNLNLVISSASSYSTFEQFYLNYLNYADIKPEQFKESVLSVSGYTYFPASHGNPPASTSATICFAQPVNMGYLAPRAYYMTFLDENDLKYFVLNSFDDSVQFQLFSDDGIELLRTEGVPENRIGAEAKQISTDYFSDHTPCRVFHSGALSARLHFVFYIPESTVMLRISRFALICFVTIAISLLLGVFIAVRFSRRLYMPYQDLLTTTFPEGTSPDTHDMQEGFHLVAAQMKETRRMNERFRQELQSYYDVAREKALLSLMTRSTSLSHEELVETAEICGLPLSGRAYQAALFRSEQDNIQVSSPASNDEIMIFNVHLSSRQLLLLAVYPPEKSNPLPELAANCGVGVKVGLSRAHLGIQELSCCIEEADAAFHPPEMPDRQEGEANDTYYPLDLELQIMAAVNDGQSDIVNRLLNDIYVYTKHNMPDRLPLLFDCMISTASKLCDSLTDEQKTLASSVKRLEQLKTFQLSEEQTLAEISGFYRCLCGLMSSAMHDKNQSIIQNVREYLNECYADPSLCLDSVAEHLNVSYYFLSRIFKNEASQSFSDMLNDTRIYRAMELLQATDLPVQTIASQVGYTNWSTFLRAFKKRSALTPVQYRNHGKAQ